MECRQSRDSARHRPHAGEVRHLLHGDAVQPGRCAGACLYRRLVSGQPRRHRNGPGPKHQSGANRGRRTRHCLRARAGDRQRHQQNPERLGHSRFRRHRPERQSRAIRRAHRARQPGAVRGRVGRLRRGRGAFPGRRSDDAPRHPRVHRSRQAGLRQPHPALERRLLPHAKNPLRQDHAHRQAVFLLCLWCGLHRSGHRHVDRRKPGVESGHPARRGPQHQPGD